MIELKPCPFCGGEAEFKTDTPCYVLVKCKNCETRSPSFYAYDTEGSIAYGNLRLSGERDNYRDAAEFWNNRGG